MVPAFCFNVSSRVSTNKTTFWETPFILLLKFCIIVNYTFSSKRWNDSSVSSTISGSASSTAELSAQTTRTNPSRNAANTLLTKTPKIMCRLRLPARQWLYVVVASEQESRSCMTPLMSTLVIKSKHVSK